MQDVCPSVAFPNQSLLSNTRLEKEADKLEFESWPSCNRFREWNMHFGCAVVRGSHRPTRAMSWINGSREQRWTTSLSLTPSPEQLSTSFTGTSAREFSWEIHHRETRLICLSAQKTKTDGTVLDLRSPERRSVQSSDTRWDETITAMAKKPTMSWKTCTFGSSTKRTSSNCCFRFTYKTLCGQKAEPKNYTQLKRMMACCMEQKTSEKHFSSRDRLGEKSNLSSGSRLQWKRKKKRQRRKMRLYPLDVKGAMCTRRKLQLQARSRKKGRREMATREIDLLTSQKYQQDRHTCSG